MWPIDRWRDAVVLRVCRDAVERWEPAASGLCMRAGEPLARPMDAGALETAVTRLFAPAAPAPRRVDVVAESAWLPVVPLGTGAGRGDLAGMEALLSERLAAFFDGADDPVADWTLLIDGLPGEAGACGYGLRPRVHEALARGLRAGACTPASVQPAWTWARRHASQRGVRRHSGWWLWQESDRTLVARLERGRVLSLHPAAAPVDAHAQVRDIVAAEAARLGADARAPVLAGGWRRPQGLAPAVRWLALAAD